MSADERRMTADERRMTAEKRLENAAERCRKAANSYYNRGLVRARERDLSGAAPLLKRALELDKTHMEARNLLGLVFYESGEVGDALVQWVISMGLQPENNPAIRYLDERSTSFPACCPSIRTMSARACSSRFF